MPTFNDARLRLANDRPPHPTGDYVLYWMQAFRRLERNHALDHALHWSRQLKKPLVVYEGLRLDYPWASARHHRFMIDGMIDNRRRAGELGINYWPYVETPDQPARGLLRKLSEKACLVVTDDYPAFVVPKQIAALAARIDVPLHAIDGNSIVPLRLLGPAVTACAHLRHRIHRLFAEAWQHRAIAQPVFTSEARKLIEPPFKLFAAKAANVNDFIVQLPIDQTVQPVTGMVGGSIAGGAALKNFLEVKLPRYGEGRNQPDDPERNAASG
ncbi:MAG: deoxyribodipyrimidine photolyase, partial [Planctomycetes bacterium]|nr:deoxyribodipyrimidine photolyase [Planctomycetota bacterium]